MRTTLLVVSAVVALTYLIGGYVTLDRRDAVEAITSLINDAAAAAEDHDISGLMRPISTDYKDDSGARYDQLRMFAAQAMRSDIAYEVEHSIISLKVRGDRAVARVYVRVDHARDSTLYERDLTLHFQKEPGRHALLIPVRVWRVLNVEGLGLNLTGEW